MTVSPIDITPEQLQEEIAQFNNKLSAGLKNLQNAGDIGSGVTSKEVIYQEDKLVLYRYKGSAKASASPVPILIVYALVNRPYMLDIQENRSTIRNLLAAGQDVYLIDWGYPEGTDSGLTLDDYINGYIDRCVDVIRQRHQLEKINLLGVCQGGAFSLCYTALHQEKIRNLITMVTPVDFHTPTNMLSAWVREIDVDLMVDTLGNIPGELLNWTFLSLKPFSLTGLKYVNMVDTIEDPEKLENFLRMEKWISDSPDQAGEAFRQFVKEFFQQNGLLNGTVTLADQKVNLSDISCPIFNIYGEQDHLVPPAASQALKGVTASKDYSEHAFPGGHIGIYVSGKAQGSIPAAIGTWLDER